MKKAIALLTAILVGLPSVAQAQEEQSIPVVGGKAVLTIIPDTVRDTVPIYIEVCPTNWTCYAPGEEPVCPECPPPPAWECPDGWTCTPPTEPEANFVLSTPTGDYADGDTIPDGAYDRFFEDAAGEWRALGLGYNADRVPGIDSIVFFDGTRRLNREALYPYGVWNERGNWNAVPGEPYTIIALMYQSDGEVVADTIAVTANPNVPPIPPDTVPPEPGDSIPEGTPYLKVQLWQDGIMVSELGADPFPGRTQDTVLAGTYNLILAENRPLPPWDSVLVGHPIGEKVPCDTMPCDVYPDGFVLNDGPEWLDYPVAWDLWGPAETNPNEDAINPEYIDGRLVHFFVAPPPDTAGMALHVNPWRDFYLADGMTIQDGGYSISLHENGSEDFFADSVTLLVNGEVYTHLTEPKPWQTFDDAGTTWSYGPCKFDEKSGGIRLNVVDNTRDECDFYGDVTLGYRVYRGGSVIANSIDITVAQSRGTQ